MTDATGTLTVLEAIVLGIVQGLTEWLPVSSSGHLVIAQALWGVEAPVFFDLLLHVGTLLVVLIYYRTTIRDMLHALWTIPRDRQNGDAWRDVWWANPHRRLGLLVVLGSIPAAIAGFTLEDTIVGAFDNPTVVGIALLFTGTLLWGTRYALQRQREGDLTWTGSLLVGVFQSFALFPGVSRSGSTICAATFLGVERDLAVKYSFLLSVPIIAGATLFQATETALQDVGANLLPYLAGVAAAMLVGYLALALLVAIARRGGLHWFALYCWTVGAAVLTAVAAGTW